MPKWLRKLFGREEPDPPGIVLGYALKFVNEDLGLEHVGFPLEILGTLEDMGLLDHGAPPNREGRLGMTPLHWAAARGHEKVVDMLLEAGADPKALSWAFLTPAEVAGLNGHSRLARKLREKAGRPHEVDPLKITMKRMGITGI